MNTKLEKENQELRIENAKWKALVNRIFDEAEKIFARLDVGGGESLNE